MSPFTLASLPLLEWCIANKYVLTKNRFKNQKIKKTIKADNQHTMFGKEFQPILLTMHKLCLNTMVLITTSPLNQTPGHHPTNCIANVWAIQHSWSLPSLNLSFFFIVIY
jgi:hypothetical protein